MSKNNDGIYMHPEFFSGVNAFNPFSKNEEEIIVLTLHNNIDGRIKNESNKHTDPARQISQ